MKKLLFSLTLFLSGIIGFVGWSIAVTQFVYPSRSRTVLGCFSDLDGGDNSTFIDELLEKCFSITRTVCSSLEESGISYDFYTNALQKGSSGDDSMVKAGFGRRHFERILESLGRSIDKPMFSFEKLWELVETSGGKERGKIIITPTEGALGLGYRMRSSVQQHLVVDASKL